MTVKMHVRDALLAALMLTGTIEAPKTTKNANAAPPLPETPVCRLGELWRLGNHRVLCGDATSAEAVARLYPPRSPIRTEYLTIVATDE